MMSSLAGFWAFLTLALDIFTAVLNAAATYARPSRLNRQKTDRRTAIAMNMLTSPDMYLALRIWQSALHLCLGLSFVLWAQPWWPQTVWGGFVLVLLALLLMGLEFFISGRVARRPERWFLRFYRAVRVWTVLLKPLTWVLLRFLPSESLAAFQPVMTEDDLRDWVNSENEVGGLQEEERRMIYSIFQFGETLAREIMIPRLDVTALDVNTPLDEAVRTVVSSGHSRVPVYEDTVDNIIGLLYAKDLLVVRVENKALNPRALLRPAYFVPETKKVDELLAEMQTQRIHMAIVVDEYGGFAGLVTLEDIVEEIVGEILDEYDQAEEQPVVQVGPQEYLFLGRINLDDFNEVMHTNLTDEEAETLAGYLYDQLGRVPVEGETLQVDDLELIVEQVGGRRIRRVRARKLDIAKDKTDGKTEPAIR